MLKYQIPKPNLDPNNTQAEIPCVASSIPFSEIMLNTYNNRLTTIMIVLTVFHYTFCSHLISPPPFLLMVMGCFQISLQIHYHFLPKRYTFYLAYLVLSLFFPLSLSFISHIWNKKHKSIISLFLIED